MIFSGFIVPQTTNEESLKHLSAYLEALQHQRLSSTSPKHINFYVRDKIDRGINHLNDKNSIHDSNSNFKHFISESFKLIRIPLEKEPNVKRFLTHILESCSLSTEKVENLKFKKVTASSKFQSDRNVYSREDGSIYEEYEVYARKAQKTKQNNTLK